MKSSILSLPKRNAEFIEPMECAPVTKLLDGSGVLVVIGVALIALSRAKQPVEKASAVGRVGLQS
jgi:hypothetical protein